MTACAPSPSQACSFDVPAFHHVTRARWRQERSSSLSADSLELSASSHIGPPRHGGMEHRGRTCQRHGKQYVMLVQLLEMVVGLNMF